MSEIDVSKCEFYNNNYCFCYRDDYGDCYHKCIDEELKNCYYKQLQKCKQCLDEIEEICSNSLSVKLLFKDRIDLAIFIRKRIKEVKQNE